MKLRVGLLLVLAGCHESTLATHVSQVAHGALESPAAAVDLDPDPNVLHVILRPAPDGSGWAYNHQIPGPTLRAKVGDTLIAELHNDLPDSTTLHWHGVSVPNAMDGITPVAAGASFVYQFTLTHAGTFWYHPHFDTEMQVDLGLYGALIVEQPTEPAADRDLVLVFDSAGSERERHGESAPFHPLERFSERWTVNGVESPVLEASRGERIRARLINAANHGYLQLRWPNLRHIGGDQGLSSALAQPSSIVLAPGDRAEVEWLADTDFTVVTDRYSLYGGVVPGDPIALMQVQVSGAAPAPVAIDWPFSGEAAPLDPGRTDIVYTLWGGEEASTWMINGERFPNVTMESVDLGSEVIIELRNLSVTEHPFHLHGHAFEVLSTGLGAETFMRREDTINVRQRERVRLRLLANNPGAWMAHCHILPHAEGGMMTMLQVGP